MRDEVTPAQLAEDTTMEPDVTYASEVETDEDDEQQEAGARRALAALCRAAHALGVVGSDPEDQVSLRCGGALFLIKPVGVRFHEAAADNLVALSAKELAQAFPLHHALFVARPDVRCVLSAANRDCELVAVTQGEGLLPLCQDALRVYHKTRKAAEDNLGSRAARASHSAVQCWLVKNRGLLASGDSPAACLAAGLFAARAAAFQVRAVTAVAGDVTKLDVPCESDAIRARQALELRAPAKQVAERLLVAHL